MFSFKLENNKNLSIVFLNEYKRTESVKERGPQPFYNEKMLNHRVKTLIQMFYTVKL